MKHTTLTINECYNALAANDIHIGLPELTARIQDGMYDWADPSVSTKTASPTIYRELLIRWLEPRCEGGKVKGTML